MSETKRGWVDQQMNLNTREQFNYAKFSIYIDEMDDGLFVESGVDKEKLKETFFEVYNNNPKKDFSFLLDAVFGFLYEKFSEQEKKRYLQKIGNLRMNLAIGSRSNFPTTEYIYPGNTEHSGGKAIVQKDIKAKYSAASGGVKPELIRNNETSPISKLDSPEEVIRKSKELADADDEKKKDDPN